MKILLSLLLSLVTLSLAAQEKESVQSTTWAVVIGISDYQNENIPDLKYAHKDAELFANYLASEQGGQVPKENIILLTDSLATGGQVVGALVTTLDKSKRGDKAIFYFSGHGDVERSTQNQLGFLLCWDSPSRIYMAGGSLTIRDLQDVIATLSEHGVQVLFIADVCHPGKLSGSAIAGPQLTASNLAMNFANEIKILACQPDEYSIEGKQWGGGHGVFTYHLVQGLWGVADLDGDRTVTTYEMDKYLGVVSDETAPHVQTPMVIGSGSTILSYVSKDIVKGNENFPNELLLPNKGFPEISVDKIDDNEPEVPRFNLIQPYNICNGQALITASDSFEIVLDFENKVDFVLINQKKLVNIDPDTFRFKIPLDPGLNKIKISALNKLKSKVDSLYVFSENKSFYPFSTLYKMNHHALFIATDSYQDEDFSDLQNPIYDATTLANELETSFGFETDTLINPTKREILTKLHEISIRFNSPKYMDKNDHLLIFISGHGAWDPQFKQGHLVASDSKADDPIYESYISYADLQNKIDNLGFKHILVVVDACYGGTFDLNLAANTGKSSTPYSPVNISDFVDEKLRYKTRRLLAAGRDVPVYDGFEKQHSPFVRQFLEALRNTKEQVITIQGLQQYLDKSNPVPHSSVFGSNDPGSNFLFLFQGR